MWDSQQIINLLNTYVGMLARLYEKHILIIQAIFHVILEHESITVVLFLFFKGSDLLKRSFPFDNVRFTYFFPFLIDNGKNMYW